jgi:molybdopterin synthase catalytic subunit
MGVTLLDAPFNPWVWLETFEKTLPPGKHGACAAFVGSLRDFNEGENVREMFLEHYPGMTERELEQLVRESRQRWPLLDVRVAHRVGLIQPGEPIVLVAAWSTHRGPACDACRFLIEELKRRAPFWKRESLADATQRWVSGNSEGYAATNAGDLPAA